MKFYSDKEGAITSRCFADLIKQENILHYILGHRGKIGRKAMLVERLIRTLNEMQRLKTINTLEDYICNFKKIVNIYNKKW